MALHYGYYSEEIVGVSAEDAEAMPLYSLRKNAMIHRQSPT